MKRYQVLGLGLGLGGGELKLLLGGMVSGLLGTGLSCQAVGLRHQYLFNLYLVVYTAVA